MYYSYVEIEYVATRFSPARMDLALKLLRAKILLVGAQQPNNFSVQIGVFCSQIFCEKHLFSLVANPVYAGTSVDK